MLSCDGGTSQTAVSRPLRVIPSPNGELLAVFEAETTCDERAQTVTLLDPHDLSVVDGPFDVPEPPPGATTFGQSWTNLDMGWTEGGAFATSYWGSGLSYASVQATLYRAGQAPQSGVTMTTDCFYPPSSSSAVRDDAAVATIDEVSGLVSVSDPADIAIPHGTFGCD